MQRMASGASTLIQSSYPTTFNTHKRCYQFLHMPFGLKMSQDVFQMCMDQITDRLLGIIVIHNDICVYGKDMVRQNRNLLQPMQTATQQGLVFNTSKCVIHQSLISFYGTIFTAQGMKLDPAEAKLCKTFQPQIIQNNSSPLSLINYVQPFLPGFASKTTFLREQK